MIGMKTENSDQGLWNHLVALEDEYYKKYGKFSYIKLNESEDEEEIERINEREEYLQDLASLESERLEIASELQDEFEAMEEDEEIDQEDLELKISEMEEAFDLADDSECARIELECASAELKSCMEKQK